METCIGIDLGGTLIKAAIFESRSGQLLSRKMFPTRNGKQARGHPAWAESVALLIREFEEEFEHPVKSIGVASPGLASRDRRTIAHMPGRMVELEGFDWTGFLGRSVPVPVINDGHAALLGEVWQGAARGLANVVLLTLGTGVGGAVFAGGRLLTGHIGRAGHVGHLSVFADGELDRLNTPGSLQDMIGEETLGKRTGGAFNSTVELIRAVEAGDRVAVAAWEKSVRDLAAGLVSLMNLFDPEAIVIGGGVSRAGDNLFVPLQRQLDRFEWRPGGHRVAILPAQLRDWAGAYGAAYLGLNRGKV